MCGIARIVSHEDPEILKKYEDEGPYVRIYKAPNVKVHVCLLDSYDWVNVEHLETKTLDARSGCERGDWRCDDLELILNQKECALFTRVGERKYMDLFRRNVMLEKHVLAYR